MRGVPNRDRDNRENRRIIWIVVKFASDFLLLSGLALAEKGLYYGLGALNGVTMTTVIGRPKKEGRYHFLIRPRSTSTDLVR